MNIKFVYKLILFMKLTTFLILLTFFKSMASGYAQISINKTNSPFSEIIKAIENQCPYTFLYDPNEVKDVQKLSVHVRKASVTEVLDEVFAGLPLTYKIVKNTILIRRTTLLPHRKVLPPKQSGYSGRVVNAQGQPLAAVSILIKRTDRATHTDEEGRFELPNAQAGDIVVLTMVGYEPRTLTLGEKKQINLVMEATITTLEAVKISTGFQRREKNVMIGSISSISGEDLETSGITTIDKALSGRLPGVYVRSNSGRPGEVGTIIIRGQNTLTGNTEPLYVLDGMPMQPGEVSGGMNALITNGIGNIPPENIETITILKDATAASIYGSRAANGVIVITTKTGEAGRDYINYTGKLGVTMMPTNQFNFMNTQEKIAFERSLYEDFGQPYEQGGRVVQLLNLVENAAMSREEAERQIALLEQTNTDWIPYLYRRARSQSHNISMSGGNTKTTYFAALNYQNSQGSLIENRYQLAGLNMKLSRFINEDLLVRLNVYGTYKSNREGQPGMDAFKYAVFANPYEKPYNEDGSYASDMTYRSIPFTVGSSQALLYTNFNILRELRENTLTNTYGNMRGQLSVEYDFLKHFKYTGNAVVSYTSVQDKDESRAGTYRSWANNWLNESSVEGSVLPEHDRGFLIENSGRTMDYTIRNTLEYNRNFNSKHFVQGFFANEFGAVKNDRFDHFNPIYLHQYAIAGYPSWDLVPSNRFLDLDLERFGGTYTNENRSVSFIGSGVYSYDNRYVFNGNVRYDGVDIIGSENQFSPLWSAGVRWNAHNESFLKEYSDVLSRLVLSAGYGYRGSINRSVYPFHTYTVGSAVYNNIPLASAFNYGNPVIKWEKKQETNLGLEVSFFKGRINADFRYFDEKVVDLLDNTLTPASSGRKSAVVNVGSMTNQGFEIATRFEVVKNDNMLWEIGGNITKVKNELVNVFDKEMPYLANSDTRNIEGYPVNSWFGYKAAYVDPETGSQMVYAQSANAELVGTDVVHTYQDELVDLSKTATSIMQTDYRAYYLGQRNPDLYGGFNTRLQYKAFELMGSFVFATGNQILSFQDRNEGPSGRVSDLVASRTNRLRENLYRWRQAGDVTNIPVYKNSASSYTWYLTSNDLESGAYLKCNELALSWRAKGDLLKNSAFKTLRATVVAGNLFMLTKYSGTDPETQTPFGYPNTRNYTLSITVGF